ncbi:hypothetical protein EVAR_63059_1 [Eumeta japonica]|uniref:Uncharacterized protein n=1 Tax=Eumeta variegata TaxID=151549 RepID=A0A4C1Z8G1_EUMVA|nr:hypothetical protein EVAR_63059_1 [Eumeta japonica]
MAQQLQAGQAKARRSDILLRVLVDGYVLGCRLGRLKKKPANAAQDKAEAMRAQTEASHLQVEASRAQADACRA